MKISGSELLARSLEAGGIDTGFAIAGDHTLPLMDVMSRRGFRFVDTRHEQGAVDMANAYGRIVGKPGLSMFTTPGHANAIPGLTLAHKMESPVINITGCADQSRLGQGAAQEIDQVAMAAPVTKGSWIISDARRIPEYMAMAFRTTMTGRRGPVHLTVPLDVQLTMVEEADVKKFSPSQYLPANPTWGDPEAITSAVELLRTAKRPVAVIGNGGYTATQEDLERFTEITKIPVLTELAARGTISDDHPNCLGLADVRFAAPAMLLDQSDVVLLLGKRMDFSISFGEPPTFSRDVRVIQVEPEASLLRVPREVEVAVHGSVGPVVRQLSQEAEGHQWTESLAMKELKEAQNSQRRELSAKRGVEERIHAMEVHIAMDRHIDEDTCLVFEGSDFAFYGAAYHSARKSNRWFVNGTLGMIGWGIPFGIGASVALPGSKVVVFTGDGAFGFNAMEVDTAVRHNIPVVAVIGNDSVWGIDYHQQARFYDNVVATELLPSRYDKMAEALGAHGEYVDSVDKLQGALARAFAYPGPSVVNIQTEPSPSPLTEWIVDTLHRTREKPT